MNEGKRWLTIFWRGASSGRLALVLVGLLILFSLAGAVLPQEGLFAPGDIALWQKQHPTITALLKPVGFFRVFHSIPFLATIFLLGVNTLTCTVVRFVNEGAISAFKGPKALRNTGFFVLHLSLIALFTGGAWSSAIRMDGYIILTEGQSFKEEHSSYLKLVEGPLRHEHHKGFVIRLKKVQVKYEKKRFPVDVTSNLEVWTNRNKVTEAVVKVNQPFTYQNLAFTQDQTGFSPRLVIRNKKNGRPLLNSFVALKTFRDEGIREYRDFLPLPFFKQRKQQVIVTLYPSFTRIDGQVKKAGEVLENPILLIEIKNESGEVISQEYLPFKHRIEVGDYLFGFEDIRQWSSFRVVEDPGYPVVWIALWVGLGGFILRYLPDFRGWFKEDKAHELHELHEKNNKKFCGGSRGAVFQKSPLAAGGKNDTAN